MIRAHPRKAALLAILLLAAALLAWGLTATKELSVRMLYATQDGAYDTAAYGHLQQSLVANLKLERQALGSLNLRKLQAYDTVYLDPSLHAQLTPAQIELLRNYVREGGHLFLENAFAGDLPPDLLGAQRIVDVKPPQRKTSGTDTVGDADPLSFPETEYNLQSLQALVKQFADTYYRHDPADGLKDFSWGKGIIPSTAETVVSLGDVSLYTLNRYGKGTVFFSGTLLPNRYYITGYDLAGGMDSKLGFDQVAAAVNAAKKPVPGALYFNLTQLPMKPFFHSTFATGSALFRSEYAAFVSKEKLGYSVKKVLGPYGRPAMAYQNHFEALEAIRDGEGIQWAELLKKYKQVPSFSLDRSSFTWGRWQESVAVHLNTGTNEKPAFAGETPNSFYSSGTRLMADGQAVRLANYPEYKSLGDPITLPYRAYPAIADLDGDGRPDLIVGSGDGAIYVYRRAGPSAEAYGGQQLPAGLKPPDAFGRREVLRQRSGEPLTAGKYASVAAYDLNGDGRPDLVIGRADGTLAVAYGEAGGTFTAPVPLLAGGRPITAAAPAGVAVGNVTGSGIPDLVVGGADGTVTLYRGERGPSGKLAWGPGSVQFKLPAPFAAPSIRDMDGDGRADLVIGSLEGDLRVYLQQPGPTPGSIAWRDAGVIEGASTNQLGSHALVGGHNSVPLWYDLNHDGKDDLIVGQLEFGIPSTIDDPKFPYAAQLGEFIHYTKAHDLELYPHLFMHNFTSDAQEKQEIALHKLAFDKLGIPWKMTGTNQHTWRINNPDRSQTLNNERAADIWFNFGFKPSNIGTEPRLSIEYYWGLPFLMTDTSGKPDMKQPMMLYTPAPVLRTDAHNSTKDLFEAYTALDLPIDYFEHIEYHFPSQVAPLLEFVRYLDGIRNDKSYNFMTETQMARSFMNTLTTRVKVTRPWRAVVLDRLARLAGVHRDPSFEVEPDVNGVPAQAAEYAGTLGLVVERGAPYADKQATALGADVHDVREGKLYLGVPKRTEVRFTSAAESDAKEQAMHLLRVNVPYELKTSGDTWTLQLKAAGMQQIQLRSSSSIAVEGAEGLTVERNEAQSTYTVTHFGKGVTLTIRPKP
ncbi:VCBS repeat-containing protein [Paenibacillus filicis]|uniref:VCBS repeat-containing protein n=1 Tax=Paenibacillus gyeongsangnamensis TaxID=3388067 RepID=A0ABT4QDH1_9BACL|nr:VCBS repeat-containing protein [Paenibacillus filicis]MCZ8514928.1 VCBS repeat-containing protein [Paenibacillus filicis]